MVLGGAVTVGAATYPAGYISAGALINAFGTAGPAAIWSVDMATVSDVTPTINCTTGAFTLSTARQCP